MKSTAPRDPKKDIMLSPGNAALILIDYQPPQVSTVESMDRQTLINNVVALCKTAKLYELCHRALKTGQGGADENQPL